MLHSDTCGSILACSSPQLFAAYRVLLRLPMPRHSPCALISLTIFDLSNYASFSFEELIAVFFTSLLNSSVQLCVSLDTCFPHCIYLLSLFNFQDSLFPLQTFLFAWWAQCAQVHLFPSFPFHIIPWWAQVDSNHRPHAYQACALTT